MSTSPVINWDPYFDEAVETLCQFIRIDTSNPPGNERKACDFLGAFLHREGIAYDLYDAGDDRISLRAVLKGDGSKRPFMLLNHTDVVPVELEFWEEDPFAGLIKDGQIWGRGTLDMKGLGIAQHRHDHVGGAVRIAEQHVLRDCEGCRDRSRSERGAGGREGRYQGQPRRAGRTHAHGAGGGGPS